MVNNFARDLKSEQATTFHDATRTLFTAPQRRNYRWLTLTAHFVSSIHSLYYDDFS